MGPNDKVIVAAVSGFLFEVIFYTIMLLIFESLSVSDTLSAAFFLAVLRRLYFFFRKTP